MGEKGQIRRLGNVQTGYTGKRIGGDTKTRERSVEKEGGDGKEGGKKEGKIRAGVDWREARR